MSGRMRTSGIRTAILSLAALAAASVLAPAQAALIGLSAFLDGLQETPPIASPGTGFATLAYDTVSHELSWTLDYSGLIGMTTVAHIHGPAPVGTPAGVITPIPITVGVTGETAPPGSFDLDTLAAGFSAGETALLGGLWYFNIHTAVFPGGEIRGQIVADAVPEPSGLAAIGLALAGLGFLRRRRR